MTTADVFSAIAVGIFGANYLLLLVGILLVLAIIIFSHRFSGAEALMVGLLFTYALFSSSINPMFTSIFAVVLLVVAVIVILFIWQRFAQG